MKSNAEEALRGKKRGVKELWDALKGGRVA